MSFDKERLSQIKVLNLYAGVGGNRLLWQDCNVTAVEDDPDILSEYKRFFPNDIVALGDAHKYLENHYSEYDFIWSSPPCPSHGQYRYNVGYRAKGYKAIFPDMKLYEEIIFLQYYFKGKWVVENVRPYYEPLIKPTAILQRHYFWSNFNIEEKKFNPKMIRSKNKISDYNHLGFDISKSKIKNKRQVLRNIVDSDLGLYILNESKILDKEISNV
jgi:DNA (cytosine-5)-methyltransferase 1